MTNTSKPLDLAQQSLATDSSKVLYPHNYTVAQCQAAMTVVIDEAFKKASGANHNAEYALEAHTKLLQAFKDAAECKRQREEIKVLREALELSVATIERVKPSSIGTFTFSSVAGTLDVARAALKVSP